MRHLENQTVRRRAVLEAGRVVSEWRWPITVTVCVFLICVTVSSIADAILAA